MADLLPNRGDGLRPVDLAQKFDLSVGQVYLTGTQALVRMCLMQAARDRMQGLQTAGYVTGYRGSPLGALDQQFQAAAGVLQAADVRFQITVPPFSRPSCLRTAAGRTIRPFSVTLTLMPIDLTPTPLWHNVFESRPYSSKESVLGPATPDQEARRGNA